MERAVGYEEALGKLLKSFNNMDVTMINDLRDIMHAINVVIISNKIFNKVF